ncbi:MAG TPA: Flp pilus assembly protein CpaB [Myxococcales bacterium]|nr:Flp pilus assembly protein CpaB [Myxococcales bacterium]
MKSRWLLMVLISLTLAAGAAYLANQWISSRLGTATAGNIDRATVIAAAADIPAGTIIQASHLKTLRLLEKEGPKGCYSDTKELIGAVANQSIYADEVILTRRIAERPGASALAAVIQTGMRAITVRVNDVAGVAGFILPGSYVDIIAAEGGEQRTILENIKVLAVGQILNREKNDPIQVRAVTLEVYPKQAEIIAKVGNIRLILRNPLDQDVAETAQSEPPVAIIKPTKEQEPASQPSLVVVEELRRDYRIRECAMYPLAGNRRGDHGLFVDYTLVYGERDWGGPHITITLQGIGGSDTPTVSKPESQ